MQTADNVKNTHITDTHREAQTVQIRCLSDVLRPPISGIEPLDFRRQHNDRTLHHSGRSNPPTLIAPVCLEEVMLCDSLAESWICLLEPVGTHTVYQVLVAYGFNLTSHFTRYTSGSSNTIFRTLSDKQHDILGRF